MKNKLLVTLAVLSLGSQAVFTTGMDPKTFAPMRFGSGYSGSFDDNIVGQPSYDSLMAPTEPKITTSKSAMEMTKKVGGSSATFAPSEAENMLSRLIGELEFLRTGLRNLRMADYATFRKYFEHPHKNEISE